MVATQQRNFGDQTDNLVGWLVGPNAESGRDRVPFLIRGIKSGYLRSTYSYILLSAFLGSCDRKRDLRP